MQTHLHLDLLIVTGGREINNASQFIREIQSIKRHQNCLPTHGRFFTHLHTMPAFAILILCCSWIKQKAHNKFRDLNTNFLPQRQQSKQEILMPEHQKGQLQVHGKHNVACPRQFSIVISCSKGSVMVLQGSYSLDLFKFHDFYSRPFQVFHDSR